jgi:Cytochrome c7 and related cytochrome c
MLHASFSVPNGIVRFRWRFLFLVLPIVLGCCAVGVRAQISPGPLSKAHQSLSGVLNCTKCHDLGGGGVQLKCLDCHTEIKTRVTQRAGMHAVWVAADATSKDCARCHSEHNGQDFQLIRWQPNRESLDHRQTGFPLTGKHAELKCEQCHNAKNIPASARATIQIKDLNHTFLGLTSSCTGCHEDQHRGQLGADCARCHTTDAWKPASGFSHATAKFHLTGAHATVACEKCHATIQGPTPFVKYTGLAFASCANCHSDPHKGSFKGTCESCHNTTSWTRVAQLEGFDHAKTAFPLVGKHSSVPCSDCHTKGDFKTPVAHAKCADCHADYHQGQFLKRAGGGDCAACHNEKGFKPSTFTVAAHAATSYPLEGKHAAVQCEKCHIPKGKDTVFHITATECSNCHQDIHQGQFAAAPYQNHCEQCHNVQGFQPAQFSLARHQKTRFPLTGAHLAVICTQCHAAPPRGSAVPVKFRYEDRSCTACHMDPHRDQFHDRMTAKRADGTALGCEACHTTAQWKELDGFDHSKTNFPLLGAHRGVACIDCHRPPALETTLEHVNFRAAPTQCSGCHADPHAGQFASRRDVTDCSSCHTPNQWKPANFDHNTRTDFSLEGAHQNVACSGCHTLTRVVAGKSVVFYKPTPRTCAECHGGNVPAQK